jgi:hypothetical protein
LSCPGAITPGGWSLALQADSGRVDKAVVAVLESLGRVGEPYAVEFSCIHEISGARAGAIFYAVLEMNNGARMRVTVSYKDSIGKYKIIKVTEDP